MVREKESWGVSPEITKVTRAVKLLADRNENVLLLGETGVGKSYIAKSLHEMGKRGKFDFLEIPCEAIGDGLPVADVFGNVEKNKTGLIGKVGRGSIYLKDIDELSPVLQNKLYNFLTTFEKRESRIIASAKPDLEKAAANKKYRVDLFHLINQYCIQIPSLRQRRQDIPDLFGYFLQKFCEEFGKPVPAWPEEIFNAIMEYEWPGNIAELQNCVRNLAMLSPEGELSSEYLPFRIKPNPLEILAKKDLASAVAEVERYLIRRALTDNKNNQSKAARRLKISEAALRYKMKKYGLPTAR